MLVLVDLEKKSVYIYTDQGIKIFNVNDITSIYQCIGNKTVYYVTSATEASAQDVATMLQNLSGNAGVSDDLFLDSNPQTFGQQNNFGNNKYLRSTIKNTLVVPNEFAQTAEEQEKPLMTFYNDHYCLPYDDEIVQKHTLLKKMIEKGIIEVIDEQSYVEHMQESNKIMEDKAGKMKDLEDKKYGNILVDGPVDEIASGGMGWGTQNLSDLVPDENSASGGSPENFQFTEVSDELNSLVKGLGIK